MQLNLHYQITIFAYSNAGRSDPAEFYKEVHAINVLAPISHISNNVFLIIILPFTLILCVVSLLLFGYNKREQVIKRQRYFEVILVVL